MDHAKPVLYILYNTASQSCSYSKGVAYLLLWPEEGLLIRESLLIKPLWSSPGSVLTPLPLPPLSLCHPSHHITISPTSVPSLPRASQKSGFCSVGRVQTCPLRLGETSLITDLCTVCPELCSMPDTALGAGCVTGDASGACPRGAGAPEGCSFPQWLSQLWAACSHQTLHSRRRDRGEPGTGCPPALPARTGPWERLRL